MRGIILAAGRGRRLESALSGEPKCLIEFGGVALVEHQIRALSSVGVEEFVIVVGYKQQDIRARLEHCRARIIFVENPIYDTTNTLYSLWLARDYFDQSFIYANGDVLFDHRLVSRLAGQEPGSRFACVRARCGLEEVKVVVEGGRIMEIGKRLSRGPCFGEFVGVARFEDEDNACFAEIISRCIRDEENWMCYFEYAVDLLARARPLYAADISDLPVIEIDFPEDLERARQEVFPLLAHKHGHL